MIPHEVIPILQQHGVHQPAHLWNINKSEDALTLQLEWSKQPWSALNHMHQRGMHDNWRYHHPRFSSRKPPRVLRRDRKRMEDFRKRRGWFKENVSVASVTPVIDNSTAPSKCKTPHSDLINRRIEEMQQDLKNANDRIQKYEDDLNNAKQKESTTVCNLKTKIGTQLEETQQIKNENMKLEDANKKLENKCLSLKGHQAKLSKELAEVREENERKEVGFSDKIEYLQQKVKEHEDKSTVRLLEKIQAEDDNIMKDEQCKMKEEKYAKIVDEYKLPDTAELMAKATRLINIHMPTNEFWQSQPRIHCNIQEQDKANTPSTANREVHAQCRVSKRRRFFKPYNIVAHYLTQNPQTLITVNTLDSTQTPHKSYSAKWQADKTVMDIFHDHLTFVNERNITINDGLSDKIIKIIDVGRVKLRQLHIQMLHGEPTINLILKPRTDDNDA